MHLRRVIWIFAVVSGALCMAGCAVHQTRVITQRTSLGYTDERLFAIQHRDAPVPDPGPSAGLYEYAGIVYGRACGADLNLFATYHGRTLTLDGAAKNFDISSLSGSYSMEQPSHMEVRDRLQRGEVVRTIEGHIGTEDLTEVTASPGAYAQGEQSMRVARLALTPRHHEVELRLTHDALSGVVGFRAFTLHAQGDDYVGTMKFGTVALPFRVHGRGSLWSMPSADQATLLPFVLTCIYNDRRLVQEVNLGYRR